MSNFTANVVVFPVFLEFLPLMISHISSSVADAKQFPTGRLTLPYFFTLSLVERRDPSNSELHPRRHKLFKEEIFPRTGYCKYHAIRKSQG